MPERAEIEAVARIIEKWCKRDMPTAYDCATEILDRVRDARDDDEAVKYAEVPLGPEMVVTRDDMLDARSPQGEDHGLEPDALGGLPPSQPKEDDERRH